MVRGTDPHAMTIAIDLGRKATNQKKYLTNVSVWRKSVDPDQTAQVHTVKRLLKHFSRQYKQATCCDWSFEG